MRLNTPKLHNKYHMELIDSVTGKIKQEAYAYNTVLQQFFFTGSSSSGMWGNTWYYVDSISFGTGTTEPQYTDTQLEATLWSIKAGAYNGKFVAIDEYTCKKSLTFDIPATTSYVGNVTEVGLRLSGHSSGVADENISSFVTRALIQDAEGNPISIEKTDLDLLRVTVDIYMEAPHVEGLKYYMENYNCLTYATNYFFNPFTGDCYSDNYRFNRCIFSIYPQKHATTWLGSYTGLAQECKGTAQVSKPSMKTSGIRLPTSSAIKNHYIHTLITPYLCHIDFPGPLFPEYPLKELSVGVGDGVTTEFEPALDFWLKDTDVIYVDGVPLVRGIDYSIEHNNNRNYLPEITPGQFIKKISNEIERNITSFATSLSCALPFTFISPRVAGDKNIHMIYPNNPLIIELDEESSIGLDVNYWIPGYYSKYGIKSNETGALSSGTLTLSYSTDGVTYTEVDTYTLSTTASKYTEKRFFNKVNAKYWKLSYSGDLTEDFGIANVYSSSYPNYLSCLGYYGAPIKFTNPPAEGAIITMDCHLDRPYKDENFVLDLSLEWTF